MLSIKKGKIVTIIDDQFHNNWWRVEYKGKIGLISPDYITIFDKILQSNDFIVNLSAPINSDSSVNLDLSQNVFLQVKKTQKKRGTYEFLLRYALKEKIPNEIINNSRIQPEVVNNTTENNSN